MCGIAGALTRTPKKYDAANIVSGILFEQRNRGPDNTSIAEVHSAASHSIIFGHNRLKVIDLSDEANQPMWDANNTHCIVYNGEIYNYAELKKELLTLGHRFKNKSDTEVVLNAFKQWGVECIQRFVGSFAFAILDTSAGTTWLVRDRFGKCPLYYYTSADSIYFASDPKALALEFDLKPNLNYALQGVLYWVYETDQDTSPYEAVKALPPAHYIRLDLKKDRLSEQLVPRKYFDLGEASAARAEELKSLQPFQVVEKVRRTLEDAVQTRTHADVRIGVALSGGLDSTTIASLLHDSDKNMTAYCFGDPKLSYTEGPLAEGFANANGIDLRFVWPQAETLRDDIKRTISAQGAPFTSASIIAQNMVCRKAKADGVSALLGGQAGDEVFMGYRKFQLFKLKELYYQKRPLELIQALYGLSKMLLSEGIRLIDYSQHIYRYKKTPPKNLSLFGEYSKNSPSINFFPATESLRQRQIRDITQISLPTLLRYEDRNGFGNGIESRLPFLDFRLVELGVAIDDNLKMKDGFGKWIIREITSGKVPDNIRKVRYKSGFDISMAALFELGFGTIVRNEIADHSSVVQSYVSKSKNLVARFSDSQLKSNKMAFAETMTILWLIDYSANLSAKKSLKQTPLENMSASESRQ